MSYIKTNLSKVTEVPQFLIFYRKQNYENLVGSQSKISVLQNRLAAFSRCNIQAIENRTWGNKKLIIWRILRTSCKLRKLARFSIFFAKQLSENWKLSHHNKNSLCIWTESFHSVFAKFSQKLTGFRTSIAEKFLKVMGPQLETSEIKQKNFRQCC